MQSRSKTVTIKRDMLDRLWICFSVVEVIEIPKEASTGQIGGFDFGIKTFLTDEQGRAYQSLQFFRKQLAIIRQRNRALSRKKADSNNHKRAKRALARAHIRIADKREDHHFKLASSALWVRCGEYVTLPPCNWLEKQPAIGLRGLLEVPEPGEGSTE